ncbi:lytic transglycosylase domain-containing protein [Amphiplicatus metriothermophilus]|uniref:Soluble lytic murein transglycosylase n=1 Tax=Amphiplicatus metriothermophilus TaxID=1519374 RepID=A0A239PIQ5_9PROT|nr:lytic transglycosylase domain-containing protein [Amphiplicatus metriothermophilus]MBB5518008.1 soluble lytic murein transglycosylase-like protein [Amphiplicatus metriothermophilus]SNT67658.1 Soluble lytic murein transglycosylase [Amphiplicatus metriothermophilus]
MKATRATFAAIFAMLAGTAAAAPEQPADPTPAADAGAARETRPYAPRVLSEADAARYAEIFALQEDGRWKEADALIAEVEDDALMGYVLYQRYMHPTDYRSRFDELKRWMAYFADHPDASKIYSLALKRRPKGAAPPVRPIPRKWRKKPAGFELHPDLEADYARTSRPQLVQIEGRVRYLTRRNEAIKALKEIDGHLARRTITERQYDRMRSWIAASLYYQGYVDTAARLAEDAASRNGAVAPLARWIAGLAAFRGSDMARAHTHFAAMAAVPHQEDSLRAAAGFWAARAALAAGRLDDVTPNLEIAASFPFTFYGQLALAQLGRDYDYDWTPPATTAEGFAALVEAAPRVRRAVALAEAGRRHDADLELRWASGEIEPPLDAQLLAVAAALKLPAAQVDIAESGDAKYLEAGLYPIPDYTPAEGFKTDRALIYALMRQESKFKVEATSRVGARGLMQLMPRTASFIARDRSLQRGKGRDRLYDPALNLELGQTYVNHLIETAADGDLFALAVAYNGGPGNLRRWRRAAEIDDPLLFIESIPNQESRDFVEHVLTNFWIYRARLGQPAPTRDRVAAGELPLYEALDEIAGE